MAFGIPRRDMTPINLRKTCDKPKTRRLPIDPRRPKRAAVNYNDWLGLIEFGE